MVARNPRSRSNERDTMGIDDLRKLTKAVGSPCVVPKHQTTLVGGLREKSLDSVDFENIFDRVESDGGDKSREAGAGCSTSSRNGGSAKYLPSLETLVDSAKSRQPAVDLSDTSRDSDTTIAICRRRLTFKQPPKRQARGHYDVLGVLRSATAAEIRAAYRKRAFAAHPDKGGDPTVFQRVSAAFEDLSDEARRSAYDRSLRLFGLRDGFDATDEDRKAKDEDVRSTANAVERLCAEDAAFRKCLGAARCAHYFLLLADAQDTWSARLTQMDGYVLTALRDRLHGIREPVSAPVQEFEAVPVGKRESPCIKLHKNGYKVAVMWASLTISTGFTKSVVQAIDWQIALLAMRSIAEERTRRSQQLKNDSDPEVPPLLLAELLQALNSEPSLEFSFSSSLSAMGRKGKMLSTPAVEDLQVALHLRRRLLALSTSGSSSLQQERKHAEQQAAQSRKTRKRIEIQLRAAVDKELRDRSEVTSRKRLREDPEELPVRATLKSFKPSRRISRKTPLQTLLSHAEHTREPTLLQLTSKSTVQRTKCHRRNDLEPDVPPVTLQLRALARPFARVATG